ncbi:hypothetical protein SAMD00019534_126570 [Acytostelium subglobosum LB1]|uniref:hypothetical protein n=1 Tax=Acytostelium subglobosum LB1 TaxID=1410327 RepID=UPI000644FF24|nr:hypothetical protein SAMD00019534_126570 [Acytostelium subglobosum LB1]GAM29481.1 hypothetical protein SAMD00019534_126570 [Acytostelium subglobosum LB1]|eukprot:XP_012747571.1 hypothetical protein SAMD00019534_126570 [Acytostelium subglobosum LB1]
MMKELKKWHGVTINSSSSSSSDNGGSTSTHSLGNDRSGGSSSQPISHSVPSNSSGYTQSIREPTCQSVSD